MEKKINIVLEIVLVIALFIFYVVHDMIPEYKGMYGSSDRFINPNKYKNMIEIKIDKEIDFSILLDSNQNIYHLMFFNKNSLILYNQNIENSTIENGVLKIVEKLIEEGYLNTTSIIKIIKYEDIYYNEFIKTWSESLRKYSINTDVLEEVSLLSDRGYELGIEDNNMSNILMGMDYYSKGIISDYNNNISNRNEVIISKSNARTYTNNVYKKIEKYISTNSVNNLEKNNTDLVITMIPADSNGKYYPSDSSWYYVKDSKIYAYIELINNNEKYGYCYMGSIDSINEGKCD